MNQLLEELKVIQTQLTGYNFVLPDSLKELQKKAEYFDKSWCGSNLGYHSRVYYEKFQPIPAGAFFDIEWGLYEQFSSRSMGNWIEYQENVVKEEIYKLSNIDNLQKEVSNCEKIKEILNDAKLEVKSIYTSYAQEVKDELLAQLFNQLETINYLTIDQICNNYLPNISIYTRDYHAGNQGRQIPPHILVYAEATLILNYYDNLKQFQKCLNQIIKHIQRNSTKINSATSGDKIFIGHGQSYEWLKLKDFITDTLELHYEEFNRIPTAGTSITERLKNMLENAIFALLVMTAEDEQSNGKMQARMNVIHEIGLFQGKLGFEKAIILLEDGCEEFSNIHGLGQIRFSKNNISSCFEEIRKLLKQHNIIN